jgi:RNA polymerase sigma-70 factor, ECF subfamily
LPLKFCVDSFWAPGRSLAGYLPHLDVRKGRSSVPGRMRTELVRGLRPRELCELSEARAIQLAQRGNAGAFERLYRIHSARVYALCLRMLKNPTEAEDSTQEVFLRVFRNIHAFRGDSAFSTWLHRVAVNTVLMRLRQKTLAKTSLDEIAENGKDSRMTRRELGGPDVHLEGYLDRVALEKAIQQLPPRCKLMFVLYDIQGYAHREIAKIAGCSVGNAKSQLHRARTRLRELLRMDAGGKRERAQSRRDPANSGKPSFLRRAEPCESQ